MRKGTTIYIKKKSVLVVGEGINETIYFSQLSELEEFYSINIEAKAPPHATYSGIVNRAKAFKKEADYDSVWCVFDLDKRNENIADYDKAIAAATKSKINIVKSFPCFEIWFLLHFKYTTRYYKDYKALKKDLCFYIVDYCKTHRYYSTKRLPLLLKDKMDKAILNCKKLEKYNERHTTKNLSVCEIHKLIQNLRNLSKETP